VRRTSRHEGCDQQLNPRQSRLSSYEDRTMTKIELIGRIQ
jgi:hypothetical protein